MTAMQSHRNMRLVPNTSRALRPGKRLFLCSLQFTLSHTTHRVRFVTTRDIRAALWNRCVGIATFAIYARDRIR